MVEMPLLTPDRINRDADYWPDRTIISYLDDAVTAGPDRTAFIDSRTQLSYAEVDDQARCLASALIQRGIEKGDRVSVQLPNWVEFAVIRIALAKIGAVINPIPPIYRAADIEYMIELLEPAAFFIPDEFDGFDYVSMVCDDLNVGGEVFVVTGPDANPPDRETVTSYGELLEADPRGTFPGLDPTFDLAEVIFTSGTTGRPKGVMHTENTLIAPNIAYNDRARVDESSVHLMPSTLGHQTGFHFGVTAPIIAKATSVLMDTWVPERAVSLVEDHAITHVCGATPFLHDFLETDTFNEHDISSLDHFMSFGAPIPRPLLADANETLGDCAVYAGWGQTEDALVTLSRPDDPDEKIIETDGYPLDGMEIDVIDSDGDTFPDAVGRLLCRGPFLMVGFYDRPDLTERSMLDDWYITGDLATIDSDGYVSIEGREKDIIIRGGENIPVGRVEDLLHDHPAVDEAAVVAMPDDRLQERACAYVTVVPGETFTFKDMADYLDEQNLATQFYPEHLVIIEEFPRTPSGKIQKYELREEIAAKLGKSPP